MRIKITKPVNGTVTVRLDDRRGLTGMRETLEGVPVGDVRDTVTKLAGDYHTRRNALLAARKGKNA